MSENHVKLSRSLSTKDLVVYGIIFMIPVAPIAFYGSFLSSAHGMVALAYLIGMVAMLFTGFSYASMASEFPYSGSVYTYVQKGTNPTLGFLSGWGITLDYILIPVITYLISASFGQSLFPVVPFWAWIVGIAVINTVINLLGIKVVSTLSWFLFGLQAIVLIAFIIGTIIALTNNTVHFNVSSFYNADHFDLSGVVQATGIVIVSYLGFDAISTLSEEANNPTKSVGKAIVLAIILIGSLFVIVTFFAGIVVPNYGSLNPDTAFLTILGKVGGSWLVHLAEFTLVLSFGLAGGQEGQTAISRILYAMGRDGILPNRLAYLHPRYNTPWVAVTLVGLVSVILSLSLSLTTVSNLISFGALFGFLSLNVAVIWHFFVKKTSKTITSFVKYLISPLIGFSVSLWIFLSLSFEAKLTGLIWLIVGFGILIYKTNIFKDPVPQFNFSE
ncbi:porin [Leuconostoc litchii]|uniref:APC family permease n=1 Tax=Leuconostoc litchii TaxID=1981069 RepID=A0A6P2CJN0_9LACO|nr:APC family permease [Leuconostoc litchii]TYC46093.1 APC family permease [Leuconostoc litchii]GMA69825.1 porin [Leuconostoc litchii]